MYNYRKLSHVKYCCEYHFVWIPKYRYGVLVDQVSDSLKVILQELCDWLDIVIIEGAICSDHVHLCLSIPPKYSLSYVMKILKGKSAERLVKECSEFKKFYWKGSIWARGYFVSTVGLNQEVIRRYIQKQREEEEREKQLKIWREGI